VAEKLPLAPRRGATTHDNDQSGDTKSGPTASSALRGHVDYVDLAERVFQGITVGLVSDTADENGTKS
jgi:hypothetical protein